MRQLARDDDDEERQQSSIARVPGIPERDADGRILWGTTGRTSSEGIRAAVPIQRRSIRALHILT